MKKSGREETPAERRERPLPPSRQGGAPPVDDGTVFHCCAVEVMGVRRTYHYLTGGLPLRVGDWVEVPLGREDRPVPGQVRSLLTCTRPGMPWPPERMKTVLGLTEAPPAPEAPPARVQRPAPVPDPARGGAERETRPQKPARSVSPPKEEVPPPEEAPPEREDSAAPVSRRRPIRRYAAALLALLICGLGGVLGYRHWRQLDRQYGQAVSLAAEGAYGEARELFDAVGGYRDAEDLVVYCQYAEKYVALGLYDGGRYELSQLTLRHTPELQEDLDALLRRVSLLEERWEEEEAQAAAERKREREREQYSGQLPVDGMPYRCLGYTLLGFPDSTEKCRFYDDLDVYRRFKTHDWTNGEGQTVATCFSHLSEDTEEEVIYAFRYYDVPIGRPDSAPPLVPPFGPSDGGDPYDVEDYSNAEDFYAAHRADFGSLDEAEMYFDDHRR